MNIPEQFGEHYAANMSFGETPAEEDIQSFFETQMTQGETTPYSQYQQSADIENSELLKAISSDADLSPEVVESSAENSVAQSNFVTANPAVDSAASQLSAEKTDVESAKIAEFLTQDKQEDITPAEILQEETAIPSAVPAVPTLQEENVDNAEQFLSSLDADLKQEAQKFTEQQNINKQLFSNTAENDLSIVPEILTTPDFDAEETAASIQPELINAVPAAAELTSNIQMKQDQTTRETAKETEAEITPEIDLPVNDFLTVNAEENLAGNLDLGLSNFSETKNAPDFPLHTLEKADSRISQMVAQSKEEQKPQTATAELQPDSAGTQEPAQQQKEKEFPTEFKLVDAEITIKGLGESTMTGGKLVGMRGHSPG